MKMTYHSLSQRCSRVRVREVITLTLRHSGRDSPANSISSHPPSNNLLLREGESSATPDVAECNGPSTESISETNTMVSNALETQYTPHRCVSMRFDLGSVSDEGGCIFPNLF